MLCWIIRRKTLQFFKYPENEKDIFVNERFAGYLIINECLSVDERKYIPEQYQKKFIEYTDLLLYIYSSTSYGYSHLMHFREILFLL